MNMFIRQKTDKNSNSSIRPINNATHTISVEMLRCYACNIHTELQTHTRFSAVHRVSKNCAKLFLPELCQISTNFDNFWQTDGKEAKIM